MIPATSPELLAPDKITLWHNDEKVGTATRRAGHAQYELDFMPTVKLTHVEVRLEDPVMGPRVLVLQDLVQITLAGTDTFTITIPIPNEHSRAAKNMSRLEVAALRSLWRRLSRPRVPDAPLSPIISPGSW